MYVRKDICSRPSRVCMPLQVPIAVNPKLTDTSTTSTWLQIPCYDGFPPQRSWFLGILIFRRMTWLKIYRSCVEIYTLLCPAKWHSGHSSQFVYGSARCGRSYAFSVLDLLLTSRPENYKVSVDASLVSSGHIVVR